MNINPTCMSLNLPFIKQFLSVLFDYTAPSCKAGLDIALVVDKSSSISSRNLEKAAEFLEDLVDKFNTGPDDDHFGLITFSIKATTVFTFADAEYHDKVALKEKIASELVDSGRGTRTDLALRAADKLFTEAEGDRTDKPNVMIVLTDGNPNHIGKETFEEVANETAKSFEVSIPRSLAGYLRQLVNLMS